MPAAEAEQAGPVPQVSWEFLAQVRTAGTGRGWGDPAGLSPPGLALTWEEQVVGIAVALERFSL